MAEEPARQQRQRRSPGRRRRRPQPQLPLPLGLRQRGLVADPVERHLPRPVAGVGARDPGGIKPSTRPRPSSWSTTTPTASGCSTTTAGRSARRPRTTRSTTRCPATSTSPRSRTSTPVCRSDVLYITNGEIDGLRAASRPARWPGRRSSPPAARTAGSSSPTTRRWCRRSSSATCPFARVRGRVRDRPRRPEVGAGHQDQALLPRERGRLQGGHPGGAPELHRVVRRPAAGRRTGQAQPRRGHREVAGQRRRRVQSAPTTRVDRW